MKVNYHDYLIHHNGNLLKYNHAHWAKKSPDLSESWRAEPTKLHFKTNWNIHHTLVQDFDISPMLMHWRYHSLALSLQYSTYQLNSRASHTCRISTNIFQNPKSNVSTPVTSPCPGWGRVLRQLALQQKPQVLHGDIMLTWHFPWGRNEMGVWNWENKPLGKDKPSGKETVKIRIRAYHMECIYGFAVLCFVLSYHYSMQFIYPIECLLQSQQSSLKDIETKCSKKHKISKFYRIYKKLLSMAFHIVICSMALYITLPNFRPMLEILRELEQ